MKIIPTQTLRLTIALLTVMAGMTLMPRQAQALITCCCTCTTCCGPTSPTPPNQIISDAFNDHRNDYWIDELYNNVAEADFKKWTEQLTSMWMLQAVMIGGFYDAQAHSTAMLELQKLNGQTQVKYLPSTSVCQFGTLAKSLAASDASARTNQLALSEIALSRHLGTLGNMAAAGRGQDLGNRLYLFSLEFCGFSDSDEALSVFCSSPPPTSRHLNRDIDYTRVFDIPETININMTSPGVTDDELDIISLAHNLYGDVQIKQRLDDKLLDTPVGENLMQSVRSINAKRSVAQNSFNAIAGLKATGQGQSRTYIRTVMQNLGYGGDDINRFMASTSAVTVNPSYMAQMEILTKKLYQDPGFYVRLMETETNTSRQSAAMEGLELMQSRDIYNAMSRTEMLMATLVEMEVIKLQSNVQNRVTNK